MRKQASQIIVLSLAIALSACQKAPPQAIAALSVPTEEWPMYQYVPSHNAVFSEPALHSSWVTQLGGRINGGLAIVGNTVYVESFDKRLYALNMHTGHILWSALFNNVVMSTPVVSKGRVIVGTGRDGFSPDDPSAQVWGRHNGDEVTALDWRNGRRLWEFHTIGTDMASPAIIKDRVIFANGDLHVYALNVETGRLLWRRSLPGVATMASTTNADDRAYISICHNVPQTRKTLSIDPGNGKILWSNDNGSCDASPSFDRGHILVDGNLERLNTAFDPGGADIVAAIDAESGKTVWTRKSAPGAYTDVGSGEHAIAGTAVGGILYQSIVNADAVVALEEATGKQIWRAHTVAPVKMSPVITDRSVIFGDTAGVFYRLDRDSGDILHTSSFKEPFSTSPPVIVGDTIFVCNGHSVLALPLDAQ